MYSYLQNSNCINVSEFCAQKNNDGSWNSDCSQVSCPSPFRTKFCMNLYVNFAVSSHLISPGCWDLGVVRFWTKRPSQCVKSTKQWHEVEVLHTNVCRQKNGTSVVSGPFLFSHFFTNQQIWFHLIWELTTARALKNRALNKMTSQNGTDIQSIS